MTRAEGGPDAAKDAKSRPFAAASTFAAKVSSPASPGGSGSGARAAKTPVPRRQAWSAAPSDDV